MRRQEDLKAAELLARSKPPFHDIVCFHCQQAAEKHLKALLEELNIYPNEAHDLEKLSTSYSLIIRALASCVVE